MAKQHTLNELAALVSGEVVGDGDLKVSGLNGITLACEGEITFLTSKKMASDLAETKATACIIPSDLEEPALPCIRVPNPEYAATVIHNHLLAEPFVAIGIDPSAQVGEECQIDKNVSIGPLACIGKRVHIAAKVVIYPGVVVGDDCVVGEETILYPNVTIANGTVLGKRVIVHANTAIGSDGFGYATNPMTGTHLKKPQVGNVQIDDDVEIGANSCVDRAAFGTTRIRSGTKIDNLVMVAHNVDIGENSILVGQVGIAGSTTLGKNVVLGGRAGIGGHLKIGDRVMVAGMSGVHTNLNEGSVVGGVPAFDAKKWGKATAVFARLPDIYKEMRQLKKEVKSLHEQLADQQNATNRGGEEG